MQLYRKTQPNIWYLATWIFSDRLFHPLGWRALKTPTSETPDSEFTWPRSRFNTSGPDPLWFDWEDLAASRGTVDGHGHSGPLLIKQPWDRFP